MTRPVDALVERLWEVNRERTRARVVDVLAVLDALARGDQADVTLGVQQAHALAGALGSYRRPGSDLFKEVERVLGTSLAPIDAAHLAERVRRLAWDLYGS